MLLEVENLSVDFTTLDGRVHALRNLSYRVEAGASLGIVGESGSGKTVSVLALMGLLADNAEIVGGSVRFDGHDVLAMSAGELRRLRGRRMSMVFQDPMTALDPVERIGRQIGDAVAYHDRAAPAREIRRRVLEVLTAVGVPDPARRARQYPHQWSGGMRQRAVIAMALVNNPDLIIADEPTTALDATVQAQVLDLLRTIRRERGCSLILISHDLGVVRDVADHVLVMYAGATSEYGPADALFEGSRHPYTRALIRARPGWGSRTDRLFAIPGRPPDLLQVPPGCPFAPRCPERHGLAACEEQTPALTEVGPGQLAACHRSGELDELSVDAEATA